MNTWAIVEVFGHQKFVGHLTEHEVGGGKLLRLEVPEAAGHPAFTKFLGAAAIYSITPVGEDVARALAEKMRQAPVSLYEFGSEISKAIQQARQRTLPAPDDEDDDFVDDEDDPVNYPDRVHPFDTSF